MSRHFPSNLPFAALMALAGLALVGCGGLHQRTPVVKTAGKITFRNQPTDGAFVVLHPKQPLAADDPRPTAHVQADGSFAPTTFESADGAPAGEYVVTIEWHKLVNQQGEWVPGPNLLPPKYASAATSDIVVQVAAGQTELPPIALR